MDFQASIESKLRAEFQPSHLQVINESHNHNVPPNSQTHFKVIMASSVFAGASLVSRHRRVYACLNQELSSGVHALAQHIYSEDEWLEQGRDVPESPQCRGGEK